MPRHVRRGFTLIELLVVIAIIGILITLLLPTLAATKRKAQVAATRSMIQRIQTALVSYKTDNGSYPRGTARPTSLGDADRAYLDDGPALYAGLMNEPTVTAGGGQNSPYLQGWKPDHIGVAIDPATNLDPRTCPTDDTPIAAQLPREEWDQVRLLSFQTGDHSPTGDAPLVLLDAWGNPIHYREWSSIRQNIKKGLLAGPGVKRFPTEPADGSASVVPLVIDKPHHIEGVDVWSSGPNGINEYGHPDSDDVPSWGY